MTVYSRNLIILISYNLYGYGRKWWMPEWYLAYSDGIKVYIYVYTYIYILAESVMILLLGGLWASKTGSRCMETTIRSVISSPSTSDNDPRLSYIWMYVSRDIYRDTYLDIWVRRVIIIIISNTCYGSCYDSWYSSHDYSYVSMLWYLLWFPWSQLCLQLCFLVFLLYISVWLSYDLQLWFYTLGFLWHEIKVYGWGFPCLDYSFDVLVSWDRDLSVYNHFCL